MSDERANVVGEEGAESSAEPEAEALAFEVSDADAGARLDAFLAARVENVSRTTLKRAIEDGAVLVGGQAAKPSHKLRAGERVEVELPAPPVAELTPEDIPLDIVYEDEEVVVVNKPAGMVVHPAAGVHSGTLANALAYHFARLRNADFGLRNEEDKASPSSGTDAPETEAINPQSEHSAIHNPHSIRPGIVHRLDRDTSGLVVVAKTVRAHENLSEQFRARTVFKSYAALVHGVVKEDKGRVEQPIARDPRNRTRMAVVRGGRAALSLWRVRRRFARMTLLDVEIKTGRTHQIRVHLSWMKHPVVGDEAYGMGRDRNVTEPRLRAAIAALGRQFLHAERLGFHHPRTGEWMGFTSPLPRELSGFIETLERA
jgi:23S rRNA pseudouridine1911/1915/1917 synthase